MIIIIANIFGFLNGVLCAASTFAKTKKKLCIIQSSDCICNIIACSLLGGFSGAIMAICSLTRNLLCYKFELSKTISWLLTIITGIIAIIVNTNWPLGIIPVVAAIEYTYALCTLKNTRDIVIALVINDIFWLVYNVSIKNYAGAIGSIVIIICAIYNILFKKKENNNNNESTMCRKN